MKKLLVTVLLSAICFTVISCANNGSNSVLSAEDVEERVFEAYKDAIHYILDNYTKEYKHSQTGGAYGEAVFYFTTKDAANSSIKVTYAYPRIGTATETGDLSNWRLASVNNEKDNFPLKIIAHWTPYR